MLFVMSLSGRDPCQGVPLQIFDKGGVFMCISHYLNAGSKQYIDALERLRRKLQTKYNGIPSALELKRIIDIYISEEQRKQRKGLEIIASVSDPTARDLLLYRYRDALPWEAIADKLMYSDKYIFVLHKKALEQFDKEEEIYINAS